MKYFLLAVVRILCWSHGVVLVIGVSCVPLILSGRCWWNHPQSLLVFSVIFRFLHFSIYLCLACIWFCLVGLFVSQVGVLVAFSLSNFYSVLSHIFMFLYLCRNRLDIVSVPYVLSLAQPIFYLRFPFLEVHMRNSTLLLPDIAFSRSHPLYLCFWRKCSIFLCCLCYGWDDYWEYLLKLLNSFLFWCVSRCFI